MEKCTSINHKEIDALSFCDECKIYMCNKCDKFHSEIFQNHNSIKLEKGKDIKELFTGFCKEKYHKDKLLYFCKIHNKLCCVGCIAKLKGKENGQHSNCEICFIEDIENEKRNKLKENIKCLEDISINLEKKINELKPIFEEINKSKEELKTNIQKIFTKLRSALNEREDKLILEVDKKYNELYFNEDIIKECDKLPNKIKLSLEKGKEIENNWNKNKLDSLINNCINIEDNIKNIKYLNDNMEKMKVKNDIKFFQNEEESINNLLNTIKTFGEIKNDNRLFDSIIKFDENLVKIWLNNRQFKAELLYRKSRDGSTPNDFHTRCDNKGITITFIETTKGYIFGGYTELLWDKSNSSKKDKSTFIFSFNNKQKYIARNKNDTIACCSNEGPRFGCHYPEIYLNKTLDKDFSYSEEYCTFLQNRLLTKGEANWDVKELEVHKIIFV